MSDKKPEKSPFAGLLAEKLKSLNLNLKEAPAEDKKKSARAKKERAERDAPPTDAPPTDELAEPEEAAPLSDAELFEKSIQEMAPEDIYRGKFAGEGPKLAPPGPSAQPAQKPAQLSKEEQAAARLADEEAREIGRAHV